MFQLDAIDHVRGPTDAPLTLVQYGDYDCPHTRASTAVVHEIERSLDVPLQFVFRHFPLRHLHANAQRLSEIAEAAAVLGHFWAVHERIMSHRRITVEEVMADIAAAGVDVAALKSLLGSEAVLTRIERDVRAGSESGVHSTPTWFFNGTLWDGHYDRETLLSRIALARGASHPGNRD